MDIRTTLCITHRTRHALEELQAALQPICDVTTGFATTDELLCCPALGNYGCAVLELEFTNESLDVLDALKSQAPLLPVIALVAETDLEFAVSVMKHGAMDLLLEPVEEAALRESVSIALRRHRRLHAHCAEFAAPTDQWGLLTSQEKDVIERIAGGESIRRIAARLDMSERTIHIRRKSAMQKLGAGNRAELLAAVHRISLLKQTIQFGSKSLTSPAATSPVLTAPSSLSAPDASCNAPQHPPKLARLKRENSRARSVPC